ncbi:GTPase HflX [Candidatus Dependentiae bacterium]|nr:GTPase HflX [Candidatus Dependentiae bacterium]
MAKKEFYVTSEQSRLLAVGIHAPYNKTSHIESYYEEFLNLLKTNGLTPNATHFMKLRDIDKSYFVTQGKLHELQKVCEEHNIEEIVFSEPLTPQQERNLEDLLHCRVFDRTRLILEIFEKHAHSAEGKAQVAIAMLKHQKTRLAGKGVHLSQQAGKIGNKGPGETQKEKQARLIESTMHRTKKQLEQLQKVRATQRKTRLSSGIAHICLIGYTNAGKSSIMNALTKSDVLAEDKLFATLDTTTRALFIQGTKIGVLSDTVGFIQNLPHNLIEAFKSTLAELQYADLLLHVIDASDPNWELHVKVVHDILQELDVTSPMVYVFNKIDKLSNVDEFALTTERYQPHLFVSTVLTGSMQPLIDHLHQWHDQQNLTPTEDMPRS